MRGLRTRIVSLVLLGAVTAACNPGTGTSWGLPIRFGQSVTEVRGMLGAPNEVIDAARMAEGGRELKEKWEREHLGLSEEWYYSSGIVASFDHGRLFKVELYHYSDNPSFLTYAGKIVEGVSLNDSREDILRKFGTPTKIEQVKELGNLVTGKTAGPHAPAVWPAQEINYWRRQHYVVEVATLKQPQLVDEKQGIIYPEGAVIYIKVYQ